MTLSIKEILRPLEGHWDRVLRAPMSPKEVRDLERQVGLSAPPPLRDYLGEVGLFQDLTHGVSSIQVYESISDFISARKFLSSLLPPTHAKLFPFGGDGAGNEYCVPSGDRHDCRIHFVDHETAKVSKQKPFADWLQSVVTKALRGIRRRAPNDRKVWAVQFTFARTSYEELARLLASAGMFKEVDRRWTNANTSAAGVTSKERRIELDGERLKVARSEYAGWEAPMLSFNLREPVKKGTRHSRIRMLNSLFKKKCPDYRLVDYGPLDSLEFDNEEDS